MCNINPCCRITQTTYPVVTYPNKSQEIVAEHKLKLYNKVELKQPSWIISFQREQNCSGGDSIMN